MKTLSDTRTVTVTMTVDQARAMLCNRADCREHAPELKSEAWRALARATQRVTAAGSEEGER